MTKIKIAFQGEKGAYSHIAVKKFLKMQKLKIVQLLKKLLKLAFEDENFKAIIPLKIH